MKIDLSGKVVLITGGSRGIGAACVDKFAEAGANIAFTYREDEKSASQLISKYSFQNEIMSYKVDLSADEEISKCVQRISSEFGRIDILVNNAGIWKKGDIETLEIEDWSETININLTGSYLFSKNVLPFMKKTNGGRIIFVSSTAGQRGEAKYSHYAASKGGIISLTKSLAAELAEYNINVNCVAPGWVYTDMSKDALSGEDNEKRIKEYIPLGRAAYPEEIAGPILFLASSLADHVNGEILNVNGGSELCG
jgi:3-oxoacyl-[acyl-carrier protein] reductase